MANIQERRDKDGKLISYSIRVHRGRGADGKQLKPYTATFDVSPTWTEKSARKKAEAFAATFEKECKEGLTTDTRQTFQAYCEYVIQLKESRGKKHSTIVRYKELTERIYPRIGHIKLRDLRVSQLNTLYTDLGKAGEKKTSAKYVAKADISKALKEKGLSRAEISRRTGTAASTINAAVSGKPVGRAAAQAVASALDMKIERLFTIYEEKAALSAKTIIEHHRLIHTVLAQAVREHLIPYNPAALTELPTVERKKVQYFQPEQVQAIRDALECEPMRWKVLTHIFLITGARRGEVIGLKWENVDFKRNKLYFTNNILYSPDIGIYEESTKTTSSERYVTIPQQTAQLLLEYKLFQSRDIQRLEGYYQDQGYLFAQDNGKPMHPDSVTDWMNRFSRRHGLPHINPHAFRHTMASMLYFGGMDSVSISKRLGHAQVSTTANIYAHVIEQADKQNAEILENIFLKQA